MTEKVKPCPFCGGKAEISGGTVYCPVCEISFSNERETGAEDIKEVVELWNARPIEDALQNELDEAREDNADNMEYHVAERELLKAENARLREALRKIIGETKDYERRLPGPSFVAIRIYAEKELKRDKE